MVQEIASIEKKLAFDSQGIVHVHTVSVFTSALCLTEDSGLSAEIDPLEAYMANVGCHLDKGKRLDLKNQLHDLKNVSLNRLSSLLHYSHVNPSI